MNLEAVRANSSWRLGEGDGDPLCRLDLEREPLLTRRDPRVVVIPVRIGVFRPERGRFH